MLKGPIHSQLSDGTEIVLRPIRPEDKKLLATGMARLSDRSRRLRFLTATDKLTRGQLAYLTEVDQRDHQAWGVLAEGEPVAVGRLVRLNDQEGEVAITVVDDWQRKGIGGLLVRLLAVLARDADISRLIFVSLPENQGMINLVARFGGESTIEDGLITTVVGVDKVPPPTFVLGESGLRAQA
jgi:RimJ/RimL family protein N-acetyltransferase